MDNILPDPLANSSIPVSTACERVKNWRTAWTQSPNGKMTDQPTVPRAVFIPIDDIKALADKYEHLYHMKVVGVRAYFGLEHPEFEGHIRFVMVPVVEMKDKQTNLVYYRDLIVEHHQMSPDSVDETSIYDFTKPCPDFCDTSSILYNA